MKKLMLGLATAGLGALISLGSVQAQDTKMGTGTGADARMKNAPTAMHGKKMMRMRYHHRRHYVRHYRRHM
jgi:hypothetical protein